MVTLGRPDSGKTIKEGYQRLEADTKFSTRLHAYRGEPVVAIFSSMKRMTDAIPECLAKSMRDLEQQRKESV